MIIIKWMTKNIFGLLIVVPVDVIAVFSSAIYSAKSNLTPNYVLLSLRCEGNFGGAKRCQS